MAPKKKKLNLQPSKFGIQHFFDRASQKQHLQPNTDTISNTNDAAESTNQVSPQTRFKFSPGMLVRQSQDDAVDEVTWKISPVNERLQAVSKHTPEVIKALAASSKINLSPIRRHAGEEARTFFSLFLQFDKATSPTPKASLVRSSFKRINSARELTGQSPFRTPPSLSHCSDKVQLAKDIDRSTPCDQLFLRPNKKALLELLDQVEDAIAVDDATVCNNKTYSFKPQDQIANELPVRVNPAVERTKPHIPEEVADVFSNSNYLVLEVSEKLRSADSFAAQSSYKVLRLLNEQTGEERALHWPLLSVDYPAKLIEVDCCFIQEMILSGCFAIYFVNSNNQLSDVFVKALCGTWVGYIFHRLGAYLYALALLIPFLNHPRSYSVISPGDTVHVIGQFNEGGNCDIDHDNNFLIVHPDILVSGTRVAASFSCPRRTVLDERLKYNDYSTAALIGTMLHQIFQAGLTKDNPTVNFMEDYAEVVLQRNIEINENDVRKTLSDAIPRILSWIMQFKNKELVGAGIIRETRHFLSIGIRAFHHVLQLQVGDMGGDVGIAVKKEGRRVAMHCLSPVISLSLFSYLLLSNVRLLPSSPPLYLSLSDKSDPLVSFAVATEATAPTVRA
ncbi:DNA replication ATP-dependent helicase/nuclease DNA2, partial [Mucuna pruriens]